MLPLTVYNSTVEINWPEGAVTSVAAKKAVLSREPRAIEPGKYTVVLEPSAGVTLVGLMIGAMNARLADEGRSFLSKAGGGTRLGEKIVDERVHIYADPLNAELPGNKWSGDGRAEAYLRLTGFLADEVRRKGFASATYAHDGTIVEENPSLVGTAGALAALGTREPALAHGLFVSQVLGAANRDQAGVAWGSRDDLYAQEWAWFATALHADALPDLWTNPAR